MPLNNRILSFALSIIIASCQNNTPQPIPEITSGNIDTSHTTKETFVPLEPTSIVDTKDVDPNKLIAFAKTLIGTPYSYGSVDPNQGFDCSGFITYVFNHFQISVPRSSNDFSVVGIEINTKQAKPGDLILFTGTDSTNKTIGHMGIIVENLDTLKFIHSTSGRANGVTITPLNEGYKKRYVKTIRVFK